MLENIREKSQGVAAKVILGLIIITFAFAGIGSYTNSVDTSVAEVNGDKISQQELEQAFQQQRNRLTQQYGEVFETFLNDPIYLNNLRNDVLSNLINEKLLNQSVSNLAIRISDEQIKKTVLEMQEFHVDGVFNNDRYLALINQAGYRESANFRDYLRVEMATQQLTQSLVASEFSLPYEAKLASELRDQTRDIRFATIASEQFKAHVTVSEDEISAYYQENQNRFQYLEKAKVDYVLLDVSDIVNTIEINEDDAKAYYQDNIQAYTSEEQRRVSHILIELGDDAETTINELKNQLDQGADFAELAKENSADTFSAENGGDLSWLETGVMVPAFETAAFALVNEGDVSSVVETEFGFHIIKLTEFKPSEITDFDDVKDEILTSAKNDAAQNKFFELKEELSRVSYEIPDDLLEAASVVGGEVNTSDWLTRTTDIAPFNNSNVLSAVFSDIVLTENLNSDVVEVSDQLAIVVHLNDYQAAETKPLDVVKADIENSLITEKANTKAQQTVDELLASLVAGDDVSARLTELGTSFEVNMNTPRTGSNVNTSIVKKAFTLPHPSEESNSLGNVVLTNGDVALVEVQSITAGSFTDEASEQFADQLASQLARSAYSAYIGSLEEQADITRKLGTSVDSPF